MTRDDLFIEVREIQLFPVADEVAPTRGAHGPHYGPWKPPTMRVALLVYHKHVVHAEDMAVPRRRRT